MPPCCGECKQNTLQCSPVKWCMDRKLLSLMEDSFECFKGQHIALSFSGGLDSAVLARLLEGRCKLYIVGTPDSPDMASGISLADDNGWDVLPIILDQDAVKRLLPRIVPLLSSPSPMTFNFNVPLFLSAETAVEQVVVAGHGADELLGGYDRYKRMDNQRFLKESALDVKNLLTRDLCDSRNIVASTGHVLMTPYTHGDVVEYGLGLSADMRRDKKVLREIARELDIDVHDRKKKAAQFGSGSAKLLRQIARQENCSEAELVECFV